ncbi:MAG: hypothetical protein KBE09_03425 [Candidatus Pacebacteria bacterium]|nr:hypothetical protein [Candidatus Paceibacterota bacterium]
MARKRHFDLSPEETTLWKELRTPIAIQDYLETLSINFEKRGDTHYSPRTVMQKQTAHCIEGALLAAAILDFHGERPLLMDFTTKKKDEDHVVALYKVNGFWGAISKTNHPILRFRDPIYKTLRELALSFAHEYFMFEDGEKTLVSYSRPLNMRRFGTKWITTGDDLFWVDAALDGSKHYPIVPEANRSHLRKATAFERKAMAQREWEKR